MMNYFYCTPEGAARLKAFHKQARQSFVLETFSTTPSSKEIFCKSNLQREVLKHYAIRFDNHFINFL